MIWLLIPAYNEEDALEELLVSLADCMKQAGEEFRMVVVNDGSRDRTADILESLKPKLPLEVVTHIVNRGLGEAERNGFEFVAHRAAREDIIVRVEGDGTHGTEYALKLIEKIRSGYDVVNTSRFQPGGDQLGVSGYRALISRCANLFMRMMFSIKGVKDYSCGFRAYRASLISDALAILGQEFLQLRGLGFTSTLEIIVKLSFFNARFGEVPFVLRYDKKIGPSKMVTSITTLGYLTMAFINHWPFGGWRKRYRYLKNYNHETALSVRQEFARDENVPASTPQS